MQVSVVPLAVMQVFADGDEVAVYETIVVDGDVGASQVTVAEEFPPVAVTLVGAPGGTAGVTEAEAAEAGPAPMALVAMTLTV
jgi:hypothetical protein